MIVVNLYSLGVDTHEHDPLCDFRVTTPAYCAVGQCIRKADVPTLFVMEGYVIDITCKTELRHHIRCAGVTICSQLEKMLQIYFWDSEGLRNVSRGQADVFPGTEVAKVCVLVVKNFQLIMIALNILLNRP